MSLSRRELIQGMGVLTFDLSKHAETIVPPSEFLEAAQTPAGEAAMPASVAGIRIVDSKVAKDAAELCRSVSPAYLFNHAMRTYLFGALVGKALGQSFDQEIFFLACILHDLGLTDRFAGDLPFEIQGAEAAKRFLQEQSYSPAGAGIVWDGIAMHASAIGQFKPPEIALVGEGAGCDVLGPDLSQISKADCEAVVKAFPRLGFKSAFLKTCAEVVMKHARGATRSFMRDVGERYVAGFSPRNFCDLVAQAPFEE